VERRRKPLAKAEGRRRLNRSRVLVAWRGTPGLDDWVLYIASPARTKIVLVDNASDRKVKRLLASLQPLSSRQVYKRAQA
jgi:hypothetical protein